MAATTVAVFVPALLLGQQRPAPRPAARPAPRPAAQPVRPLLAHREHTWEWSVGVGGTYLDGQIVGATGASRVAPGGVVRVGYNLNTMWNISVGTGLAYSSPAMIVQPFAAFTWTPDINKVTSPFVTAGLGGSYVSWKSTHMTAQFGAHLGVGIRHMLSENMALRVEVREQYENFKEFPNAVFNGIGTVGLSWFTGGRQAVASVGLTPRMTTLASLGATQHLSASPMDSHGKPLVGRVTTWTSSNNSVATVASTGLVTARSNGSANITAASEGMTGTVTVTVAQTA
ncbi:MAG: hypothetical protein B7Z72_03255, partial [Gemmatimonadetes bacterium 21-71-4]